MNVAKLLNETHKFNVPTICVTGGKGGTGKSTIAVNLAIFFTLLGKKVLLADCDVDAPDIAILLNVNLGSHEEVHQFVPQFNLDKCIKCGRCAEVCRSHAILHVKNSFPIFFKNLCTGCEACKLVCKSQAIEEGYKVIGWTSIGSAYNIDIVSGELKLKEAESAAVVIAVKERIQKMLNTNKYDLVIIDTAPGAHCDVARSMIGSDIALAVTEPTPFGAHDLDLILRLAERINVKMKVVLNRSNLLENHDVIEEICKKHSTDIIAKIPLDDRILRSYVKGKPVLLDNLDSPGAKALIELGEKVKGVLEI
ncbi:MAG: P-loop NTPase [Candidatus Baldrarchaeia archaeon]